MSALAPVDAASCRAMAVECGARVTELVGRCLYAKAAKELSRAKVLTLLALKFEQEQNLPGPHLSVGSNGDPGIPSPEAGGAKMDEVQAHPDRAAPADSTYANSGRAVPVPRADVGADIIMKHEGIRV